MAVPDGPFHVVETLQPPQAYSLEQIQHARAMAQLMNRGKLVLAEPPADDPDTPGP